MRKPKTVVVDVEYTLPIEPTSHEDPGGHCHAVHFKSKRSANRFIRALEKLIRESADGPFPS